MLKLVVCQAVDVQLEALSVLNSTCSTQLTVLYTAPAEVLFYERYVYSYLASTVSKPLLSFVPGPFAKVALTNMNPKKYS
jgi:hypothetical protein